MELAAQQTRGPWTAKLWSPYFVLVLGTTRLLACVSLCHKNCGVSLENYSVTPENYTDCSFCVIVARFCVSVRRLKFPPDPPLKAGQSEFGSQFPGHIITVAPPLVLESLLPMDVHYRILQPNSVAIAGTVKPGKKASLVTVSSLLYCLQLCDMFSASVLYCNIMQWQNAMLILQ